MLNFLKEHIFSILSGLFAVIAIVCLIQISKSAPQKHYIFSGLVSDNRSSRNTKPEFSVLMDNEYLIITELTPKSVFFKNFVQDTTIHSICLKLRMGSVTGGEYWAYVEEYEQRLKYFYKEAKLYCVVVQAHSNMLRIIFVGEFRDEIYYLIKQNDDDNK